MPQDKIFLEGVVFYGFHGRHEAEKELGQRFIVDIEVQRSLWMAGGSDKVKDTVSYTDIYRTAQEVVEGPSHDLLESVAHNIAQRVLESYSVESVLVSVKKPNPPIKGAVMTGAGVEIYRERGS